jgi:hypothetical protein
MAARTFADQANFNMAQVVDVYWQRNSPTRSATTFTLRRRTTAGVTNDLGIPNDPWAIIVTGQPCTINATREQRNRFYVDQEGQIPTNQLELESTYPDIRPGDEMTLAADSRTYSVQSVSWEGGIQYCVLDRKQAQVTP